MRNKCYRVPVAWGAPVTYSVECVPRKCLHPCVKEEARRALVVDDTKRRFAIDSTFHERVQHLFDEGDGEPAAADCGAAAPAPVNGKWEQDDAMAAPLPPQANAGNHCDWPPTLPHVREQSPAPPRKCERPPTPPRARELPPTPPCVRASNPQWRQQYRHSSRSGTQCKRQASAATHARVWSAISTVPTSCRSSKRWWCVAQLSFSFWGSTYAIFDLLLVKDRA